MSFCKRDNVENSTGITAPETNENIELVNAIAKNIKNYQDKQIDNKINNKEILNSQNPIKEQIIKL